MSPEEKQEIISIHGMRCFIDGHEIVDESDMHFDHIKPIAEGGKTTLQNLAPVCAKHNRQKGKLSLSEFRDQLELGKLFLDGQPKYLENVISAKGHKPGLKLSYEVQQDGRAVSLFFQQETEIVSLYSCPTTGWNYFYALIPIEHLSNDRDLQPRPLRQKPMNDLYRHFRLNTQLAPSICRLASDGTLLLFDGQHKAAAQIWGGRKLVECKVYLQPNPQRLKETNLEAHEAYRQMGFYSAELMAKYADIFEEDWAEYTQTDGTKSESDFIDFLSRKKSISKSKARSEVEYAIHQRIYNDKANRLTQFVSDRTRASHEPLTQNRVKKTIFRDFLSQIPSTAEFESPEDLRAVEESNLVTLMSIIADEGLIGRWDPSRNDADHRKAERIFSAGAVRAWVRVLRDVLFTHLQLYKVSPDEVNRVLYRQLSDDDIEWLRRFLHQIFSHNVWDAPDTVDNDISKALTKDDDTTAMNLLRRYKLDQNWVTANANG